MTPEDVIQKTCKICGEQKLLKDFKTAKSCKLGKSNVCTKCDNIKGKKYRLKYAQNNPDKIKAISLKWIEQNREAEIKRVKEYNDKKNNTNP
jgi:hypothetical protein